MTLQTLRCTCGTLSGTLRPASDATRIICYCDDCQALAHFLKRPELLDAHGGSDIVQVAPSDCTLTSGVEHVACVRLAKKGLFRFYAACCKMPLGNTLSASIPFIGMHTAFVASTDLDALFGPPQAGIQGQDAKGTPPAGTHPKVPLGFMFRTVVKLTSRKLRGKASPNPYFSPASTFSGGAICEPTVLTTAERAALREGV